MTSLRKACFFVGVLVPVLLVSVRAARAAGKKDVGPRKADLLSWPRTRADDFGCFLEKAFGVRDARFNCSLKGYVNKGDPCKNTDAYYEGPSFPDGKAERIDPAVKSVDLSWEHGELQAVSLTLSEKMEAARVRELFHLPQGKDASRENAVSVSIQDCGKRSTCLVIQGFDHMGAGDAECGSE